MIVKYYNYILLIMISVMLISCNNNDETKSSKNEKSLINTKANEINLEKTYLKKFDSIVFNEAETDAILYASAYCQYMNAMKNDNKELAAHYQGIAKGLHQQIYTKYSDPKRPETVIFKNKAEELADECMKKMKK